TAVRGTTDNTKVALDIALNDENGNAYSANNPLPVTLEESEGEAIQYYQTSESVAKDAVVNHVYTVTSDRTFVGTGVWASASGKIRVALQVETAPASGVFNTRKVGFNSTANPNVYMPLDRTLKVAAGVRIRISITQLDF